MMAQDPVKFNIEFHEGKDPFRTIEADPEELLAKYQKKAFLCYQWGCWVTAFAREALQFGLDLVKDTPGAWPVYCDTDSVKYTGTVDWSAYNTKCIEDCEESGAHATDPAGVEHYMGVYEQEDPYKRFITLGAKKYAYEYAEKHKNTAEVKNGWLGITVAGVGKKTGAKELADHGGLEEFKEGFIFRDAGGLESIYNDQTGSRWIAVDGQPWEIGPNVYLKPSTYTLNITREYSELLKDPQIFLEIRKRMLIAGLPCR